MGAPLSVRKNDYISNPKRSDIPTPLWLCSWLHDTLAPVVRRSPTILDPSAGDGRLSQPWQGANVINYEIKDGQDFLLAERREVDLVLCNPPFNLGTGKRLGSEVFLEKIVSVVGPSVPIVLMVPMGFRLNQRKRSARIVKLRDEYPAITSIVSLPLDCYDEVLFHSEILLFNIHGLPAHLVALPPSQPV